MSTASDRASQLELVSRLKSAYPELPDAPSPDMLDHDRILAYLKPVHDVGGELCEPQKYENKDYEYWEHMTYVLSEVLAWRGIWLSEERRRIGNVDVGRAIYHGMPYYGRWLWACARILVEKHHLGLTEITERMAEVQGRYAGGLTGKTLKAEPKCEGDGANVKRNEHIVRAQGKGDPGVYAGTAAPAKFKVGDRVTVREIPVLFYTRTPEYVRGATGEIATLAYESPAAEDETWDRPAKAEWFYVVSFKQAELWHGYTGTATDTLRTEIPEHWLEAAN
jgi:thiocyanate hydrolase subunit beta